MNARTIRELGGEIWAELDVEKRVRKSQSQTVFEDLTVEMETAILDLVMQVLARHQGKFIVNDEDLPVEPRPLTTYN